MPWYMSTGSRLRSVKHIWQFRIEVYFSLPTDQTAGKSGEGLAAVGAPHDLSTASSACHQRLPK